MLRNQLNRETALTLTNDSSVCSKAAEILGG
jgi:hypothetical protein